METPLRSEELTRLFIDNDLTPVAVFDRQMCCLLASEAWKREFGLEQGEIEGLSIEELMPTEAEKWRELCELALTGEALSRTEDSFTHTDGRVDYLRWEMRPWCRADGSTGGVVLRTERITEEVRNRRLLETSERRWRSLIEMSAYQPIARTLEAILRLGVQELGMEMGILGRITDQTYRIQYHYSVGREIDADGIFELSDTFCSLTIQSDRALAVNRRSTSAFRGHPGCRTFDLKSYIGVAIRVNDRLYGTLNFTRSDPRAEAFRREDRQFVELMGKWVGRLLEHHLVAEQLRGTIEAQREFFAVLGHDLRNQLAEGLNAVQILRDEMPPELTEFTEDISFVNKQMQATAIVFENLLTWGRSSMQSRSCRLVERSLLFAEFCEEYFFTFRPEAMRQGVELLTEGEPDASFFADGGMAGRIVHNLVRNALSHAKTCSAITLKLERGHGRTILSVSDDGAGMPATVRAQLNQDQMEQLPHSHPGKGFGLLIARNYARRHGGRIIFLENKTGGLTARLELPDGQKESAVSPGPVEQFYPEDVYLEEPQPIAI